ncbi:MAG: class I SAM-dependent methyltransferase [Armatimonadota bacterium]
MRADEIENMHRLEGTYWWFVARRRLVRLLAGKYWRRKRAARDEESDDISIADIGCGTGATLTELSPMGRGAGVDISDVALRLCAENGISDLVRAPAEALPLREGQLDLVLCLDVLEHIDDAAAARELYRICRPGGHLIVTAPAYGWLWSEHDDALGHLRRYSARELRHVLDEAGFRIVKMTHALSVLLLPIALFRLLQRLRKRPDDAPKTALIELPGPVNRLLVWVLALEMHLAAAVSLPFGVSIACVAQRPEP